jgi:serine/threonine protein kinase
MTRATPSKFGRFDIERVLGSSARGVVYTAQQSGGGQRVVIRTLPADVTRATAGPLACILESAATLGELTHPGILPLLETGEAGGLPYLVYEHVDGELLSELLGGGRQLSAARALEITIQILKAVGSAHHHGIVHRDLRPENIILASEDAPRLLGFGLSAWILENSPHAAGFCGDPAYTAPECGHAGICTPAADVFSIGMLLYRMLTGRTAVSGASAADLADQLAQARLTSASVLNPQVDERLDALLITALASNPAERFGTTEQMEDALYLYLNPRTENNASAKSSTGTLDFLLRRMRHKSDFPALSATISAINRASTSEDESAKTLSRHILKDFALTSKLLKMVNSAYFGSFGGTISTVSKAVVIMGFDRIRNAAISLMLFEHLQNKAHATRLKEDLVASYFSAVLARQLVAKTNIRNLEEAFICAMFHNLGGLLTSFYFPEEDREIQRLMQRKGLPPMQASLQVLGVTFADLGIEVAKAWNFPPRIVQSMRHVEDDKFERPETEEAKLRVLADLSTRVCDSMRELDEKTRDEKLEDVVKRFDGTFGIGAKLLVSSIRASAAELSKDAVTLNLRTTGSVFQASPGEADSAPEAAAPLPEVQSVTDHTRSEILASCAAESIIIDPERKSALFAGIQDISTTLMGEFKLNDVLREILETMYRSAGFTRVLLFIRDTPSNSLKTCLGLGEGVDDILSGAFSIPLGLTRDVFQAAVANGADVFIENVNAEQIRKHIPDSYRKAFPARSFALFPMAIKGRPVGLLYGDSDVEDAICFSAEELSLLKTLRNQAVIAIKQSA